MAAVMALPTETLATPSRPIADRRVRHSLHRLIAVFAIVLGVFAVSATPAADVVPEPVSSAVSAVVPDSIESLLGAEAADAISFRTYWSGFDITMTKSEVAWLADLGYAAASAAVCAVLAATVVGAVVCGVAAWAIWKAISAWGPKMINGTCLTLGIRWWGSIHKTRYHWC